MSEPVAKRTLPAASLAPRLVTLAERAEAAGYMDVADWARSECNGYRADVPAYRRIEGLPMGFNPLKGWIPLYAPNPALLATIGSHGLRQSVEVIEAAIAGSANGRALVHHTGEAIAVINAAAGTHFAQVATSVDVRNLQSLLTSVASLADRWQLQIGPPATVSAVPPLDRPVATG